MKDTAGRQMYRLAERLFPICRSITGNGVRETLSIIREELPELTLHEVPSGTPVFDWNIPKEWNIRDGYIENGAGERILDFKNNNLHIMGYSVPVDRYVSREELLQYVYVEETQPDAIPYVTSYYQERYGFCMTKKQRDALPEDTYHIAIDSSLQEGSLTYGELLIQGECEDEILVSTYICHPSMANNELSGPVVAAWLAKWVMNQKERHYSWRFLYLPETIGSITYLSIHLEELKKKVKAGFLLTCVGDNRTYSYIATRKGDTLSDRAAVNVLKSLYPEFNQYSFLHRGSDERQYDAPGVDLPVCVICRSKFGEYPEYHTSLDNMSLISPEGLEGAYRCMVRIGRLLHYYGYYRVNCLCEPQLGKRGLYPTVSKKGSYDDVLVMRDFLAYADGKTDLIEISNIIHASVEELIPVIDTLREYGLISFERG